MGYVNGCCRRLFDDFSVVLGEAIKGGSALHFNTNGVNVGEANGVVLTGPDGLGQFLTNFGRIDVKGGNEVNVADVVATKFHVHETRYELLWVGVAVVRHALNE